MKRALALASIPLLVAAAPASAAERAALDLPAGRLSDAVAALAAQTGASISVADGSIWAMRVAPLRGRMSAEDALRRLLRGSRARLVVLDGRSFRIVAARDVAAPRRTARPSPPPRSSRARSRRSSSPPRSATPGCATSQGRSASSTVPT
ncbi:STN domain-containing protein [Rhizorhabdus histidinilytica]